jgi:phage-related protein
MFNEQKFQPLPITETTPSFEIKETPEITLNTINRDSETKQETSLNTDNIEQVSQEEHFKKFQEIFSIAKNIDYIFDEEVGNITSFLFAKDTTFQEKAVILHTLIEKTAQENDDDIDCAFDLFFIPRYMEKETNFFLRGLVTSHYNYHHEASFEDKLHSIENMWDENVIHNEYETILPVGYADIHLHRLVSSTKDLTREEVQRITDQFESNDAVFLLTLQQKGLHFCKKKLR